MLIFLETIDFYRSLGCKRLGDLIRDELQGTKETTGSNTAKEVRSLVLGRLPLFFEHNRTANQVATWLEIEGNFIIRTFRNLTVVRSVNFAGAKSSIPIETSAAAKWKDHKVELWVIDNYQQVDKYEIAASLCRLLFNTRKANDALLLMTIFSSELSTLWKRGYPGTYEVFFFFNPANWTLVVDRAFQQRAPIEALVKKNIDKTALGLLQKAPQRPRYMPTPAPVMISNLRTLQRQGYNGNYKVFCFLTLLTGILQSIISSNRE